MSNNSGGSNTARLLRVLRGVGSNIRRHRKLAGLTQEGLAERASLSTYFIGSVERGQAALSLRSLADIASALGVTLRALFDEGDERDRDGLRRALEPRLKRATEDELRLLVELTALLQRRRR